MLKHLEHSFEGLLVPLGKLGKDDPCLSLNVPCGSEGLGNGIHGMLESLDVGRQVGHIGGGVTTPAAAGALGTGA